MVSTGNVHYDHNQSLEEKAIREHFFFPAVIIMTMWSAALGALMSYKAAEMVILVDWMGWWSIFLVPGILLGLPIASTYIEEIMIVRDVYKRGGGEQAVRGNPEAMAHLNSISAFKDHVEWKTMVPANIASLIYGAMLIRMAPRLMESQGTTAVIIASTIFMAFLTIPISALFYNRMLTDFRNNGYSHDKAHCSKCKEYVTIWHTTTQRTMNRIRAIFNNIVWMGVGAAIVMATFVYPSDTVDLLRSWGLWGL